MPFSEVEGVTPPSVLVCDDDRVTRLLLGRIVESAGYSVVGSAQDGEEAVRLARRYRPDVILMDVEMPRLSGIEAVERITQEQPTVVVMLTGYSDPETVQRAVRAGASGYLVKPVRDEQVLPVIALAREQFAARLDLRAQKLVVETVEEQAQETRRQLQEMEALAYVDGLTSLLNRRAFDQRLMEEISRAGRTSAPLSLVLLDVDHFKKYNDRFGHLQGDEVLRGVALILRQSARPSDVVARVGGEEFGLVLPEADPNEAADVAERCRAAIEAHSWPCEAVTASFGVATLARDGDARGLFSRADAALYQAKAEGRNRVLRAADLHEAGTPHAG
jgi:diguanylate cyclase (GGDEF)-like protein